MPPRRSRSWYAGEALDIHYLWFEIRGWNLRWGYGVTFFFCLFINISAYVTGFPKWAQYHFHSQRQKPNQTKTAPKNRLPVSKISTQISFFSLKVEAVIKILATFFVLIYDMKLMCWNVFDGQENWIFRGRSNCFRLFSI